MPGAEHRILEELGATAMEYAIIIGFIAVVIALGLVALGAVTNGLFLSVLPGFAG